MPKVSRAVRHDISRAITFAAFALTMLANHSALAETTKSESAPAGKSEPTQKPGTKDTLIIGTTSEFESLNPMIATQAATNYMLYLAIRKPVVLSLDEKWGPMLIKKMPTIQNGLAKKVGEGLEYTIELIDNLKWGDGHPITCKDIDFTWKIGKSSNVSIADREPYDNITAIEWKTESATKCKIKLAKAKFDFFTNIPRPLPEHLEGPVFEKFGNQSQGYDNNTLYTKDPTNPGLYNGPYVVSEVKLGSHVVFTINPNFYGKKPTIKKIIVKLVTNNATLAANLRSGVIDLIGPTSGLSIDQALAFEKSIKEEKLPFKVIYADGHTYAHIDLNLDNPALSDLKVRKALSHAINKKELIQAVFDGKVQETNQSVIPKDPWHAKDLPTYKFDRKEAIRLLEEAGWKMGSNGIRQKNGQPLSLTLFAAAGIKINELLEVYLQAQMKAVGVELKIKNEPARVFFADTTTHRKFDLAFYSWISDPENSPRSTLHSTKIPSATNAWSGQNHPGYKNAEVDKLIDKLEEEFDSKKRADLGRKISVFYANDIPVIPLYFRPTSAVIPNGLKGYELAGHQSYETLYAERWSF